MKATNYFLSLFMACAVATSCDSMLDIDPPTDTMTEEDIYSSEEKIEVAANGLYTYNFLDNFSYFQVIEINLGMCSDEMRSRNVNASEYETNNYTALSGWFMNHWRFPYQSIYQCNDFINHVEDTNLMDPKKRDAFVGEAKFFRAYAYFLLVNAFGDVPLILATDVNETSKMSNVDKDEINKQIIADLEFAEKSLIGSKNGKTKITSQAARALLARVYLYTGEWEKAKEKANGLIPAENGGTGSSFQLEPVERVFKSSSKESILHINMEGYVGPGTYVGYTRIGTLMVDGQYYVSQGLVDELQKDPKDKRVYWIKEHRMDKKLYCPYKYQNRDTPQSADDYEYLVLLRLAEQYLIRGEANVHLGNLEAALEDINVVRSRAGLDPIESVSNAEELLMIIESERRKEFFEECGHRWYDLNRTGRADAVYKATEYKKYWEPYKALLPIPDGEIARNPFLEQNEGY